MTANLYSDQKNRDCKYGATLCFQSAWSVYNKRFLSQKGHLGDIEMSVVLFYNEQVESLFAPSLFEKSVNHYLEEAYGPNSERFTSYRCRLAWEYQNIDTDKKWADEAWYSWNPSWLSFKIIAYDFSNEIKRFLIPIHDHYYLAVNIHQHYYIENDNLYLCFQKIANSIIDDFSISLSSESKQQLETATAKWPGDKRTLGMIDMPTAESMTKTLGIDPNNADNVDEDMIRISRYHGIEVDNYDWYK